MGSVGEEDISSSSSDASVENKSPEVVIASNSFSGNDDNLSFEAGDIINLISNVAGTCKGTKLNGETGYFPFKHVNRLFGPPKELHLKEECKFYVISNHFEGQANVQTLKKQYEIDEKKIKETFERLNFKVEIRRNLSSARIDHFMQDIQDTDFYGDKCVALLVLSHGTTNDRTGQNVIFDANNNEYEIQKLVDKLEDITALSDKPKLIFIQACRGEETTEIVESESDYRAAGHGIRVAKNSNTFVYYSSTEEKKSYCSSKTGSFFINALCGVLNEYYKDNEEPKYHLGDVVTRVNEYISQDLRQGLLQVSQAKSSLCQRIYFYTKNYSLDNERQNETNL